MVFSIPSQGYTFCSHAEHVLQAPVPSGTIMSQSSVLEESV